MIHHTLSNANTPSSAWLEARAGQEEQHGAKLVKFFYVGRVTPEMMQPADAHAEMMDFVTPDYAGEMDAQDGMDCDPTRHYYRTVAQCEEYVSAWKKTMALLEATDEYADEQADREFWASGSW